MLRVCNCKSASEDSLLVFILMAEECGGKKRKEREKIDCDRQLTGKKRGERPQSYVTLQRPDGPGTGTKRVLRVQTLRLSRPINVFVYQSHTFSYIYRVEGSRYKQIHNTSLLNHHLLSSFFSQFHHVHRYPL